MTPGSLALIAAFYVVAVLCVKPVGLYMANVMEGRPIRPLRAGARFEGLIYRLCGIDPAQETGWSKYALCLIVFNALGALAVYALQRLQLWLPLNPQQFANVSPDSSFNTGLSFITNTNWQGYSGESTMSYLTQMAGLAVQNFLSAATGIVVAVALVRGFARHNAQSIGNFWVDMTRATLYILLPLSLVLALVLVGQGVVQNFSAYKDVTTIETVAYQQPKADAAGNPVKDASGNPVMDNLTTQKQTLPMGPMASQEAIKELGTNGGGFLNANSAHPYENPTPLSNYITKPFSAPELLARVRAALRRNVRGAEQTSVLRLGDIRVDLTRREARGPPGEIHLTPLEYRVLECLARHLGLIVTQNQLIREVWGPERLGDTRSLRVCVKNLRAKLEPDSRKPRYLVTEAGLGYRLRADEEAGDAQ